MPGNLSASFDSNSEGHAHAPYGEQKQKHLIGAAKPVTDMMRASSKGLLIMTAISGLCGRHNSNLCGPDHSAIQCIAILQSSRECHKQHSTIHCCYWAVGLDKATAPCCYVQPEKQLKLPGLDVSPS